MKDFSTFVKNLEALHESAGRVDAAQVPSPVRSPVGDDTPVALVFSPHPDDEMVTGAYPLRLRKEAGWRIVNVAVTLGSNEARRAARAEELKAACAWLGFELVIPEDGAGLTRIQLQTRRDQPHHWTHAVGVIARLIRDYQPALLVFPHAMDVHPTHIGVNALVRHAMLRHGPEAVFYCLETEFWGAMEQPNLLVESSTDDVTELVTALALHAGEVARNPYHLRLPATLIDNVRRVGELMAGAGEAPPKFLFGTPYRLRRWHRAKYTDVADPPRALGMGDAPVFWR